MPAEDEWPVVLVCVGCGCEVRPRGLAIVESGAYMMASEDMYEVWCAQPAEGWLCAYCYLVAAYMAEVAGSELANLCQRRLVTLYEANWHRTWPPAPLMAERLRVLAHALSHGVSTVRAVEAACAPKLPAGWVRLLTYAAWWGWLAR